MTEAEEKFEELMELHKRRYHLIARWAMKESYLQGWEDRGKKMEGEIERLQKIITLFTEKTRYMVFESSLDDDCWRKYHEASMKLNDSMVERRPNDD